MLKINISLLNFSHFFRITNGTTHLSVLLHYIIFHNILQYFAHSPPRETRVRPRCARYRSDRPIQNANVSRGTDTDSSTGHRICSQDGACHCPRRRPRCGQCSPAHRLPCACPRGGVAGSDRKGAWTVPGSPAIDVCPCDTATNPD